MSTKAKRPRLSVVSAPAEAPCENLTSEDLDMRQIEIDLADAEYCADENVSIPTAEEVFLEIEDLLEELVHTASKTQALTVSRLCFLLCDFFSDLQAVSELADSAVCRKNGVTFEWRREKELERVSDEVQARRRSKKALAHS